MPALTDARKRRATIPTKEERGRDAASAVREYEAQKVAVLARTARLRALRLAKEAEGPPPAAKKKRAVEDR
jgi:hypothetical protein